MRWNARTCGVLLAAAIVGGVTHALAQKVDFSGQKIVFYFYPKDDTSGCTAEAQAFTALADEFEKSGTWIVGISKDDAKKHARFIDKYDLKVSLARWLKR